MHSTTRAKVRDKAQRPSAIKSQPYIRLKQSTLELMHIWTSPDQQKKTTPEKHVLCLPSHDDCCDSVQSLAQLNLTRSTEGKNDHTWKTCPVPFITWWMLWQCSISWAALKRRRLSQLTSTNPCSSVEMVLPWISGQQFNQTTDRVRPEKKADCFTLLKRITSLKIVNSEIRSEDQGS